MNFPLHCEILQGLTDTAGSTCPSDSQTPSAPAPEKIHLTIAHVFQLEIR